MLEGTGWGEKPPMSLFGMYSVRHRAESNTKLEVWDLSGGPVAKASHSQCRELGFAPWSGDQILHAATKTRNS